MLRCISMSKISRRSLLQGLLAQIIHVRPLAREQQLHGKPKPLSSDAITDDWPSFLGPSHNAVSIETRLNRNLPPPLLWEFPKGTGYGSPAIADNRLVFMHRQVDHEIVECLHPETGAPYWQYQYATSYRDRYGYNNGPRSSPVIDTKRVYTVGAEGKLHCLDLISGQVIWQHNLQANYKIPQGFFGTSSTPLVDDGLLIVNVGAPGGPCVVGLDVTTGREVWRVGDKWGPSYASPVPAKIHGRRRIFIFAGGDSRPPTGGLMAIDPETGRCDFEFPWRSRLYESVNASCPVVFDNKVFISASYRTGSALIEIRPDFTPRVVWTTNDFGLHFNTAIFSDGYLYGFDGRNQGDASLACVDASTGVVIWREIPEWVEMFELNGQKLRRTMGTARGSLLAVDGHFLALGELGHLLWIDLTPDGYKEISRTWLVEARESWTLPVLSRGLLYVVQTTRGLLRGTPPRLLCYALRT